MMTKPFDIDLRDQLKARMAETGITAYRLKQLTGVHHEQIYRYLRGQCGISDKRMKLIVEALGGTFHVAKLALFVPIEEDGGCSS